MKNRKNIFSLLVMCLFFSLETSAQVMEWAIQPSYKDIVCLGKDLYKVKATNGKWGIYNISKREMTVPAEYDNITPLVEGRCLILDVQGVGLYGIVDEQGNPVSQLLPSSQKPYFVVTKEYPYYSDGLLALGQLKGEDCLYGYVDKQGNPRISFKYWFASPFDHGQAMVYTTNKTYQIINQKGESQYKGDTRIAFMSNPDNGVFLLATKDNRISKVRLENSKFSELEVLEKGRIVVVSDAINTKSIYTKGGKDYLFNNAFHYIEGNTPSKVSPVLLKTESYNHLKKHKAGFHYGISYNNEQILSGQFKDVKVYDDKYAIVTLDNNSVGLLTFNPSGKIRIEASSTIIEFAHHQESSVPINVICDNMMSQPEIELTVADGNQSRTFYCKGSGQVQIPFYEAHDKIGASTRKTLEIELVSDKLKLGRKSISIESNHKKGFAISIGAFPTYSNKDNSAVVNVSISSVGGVPSQSAVAVVNGSKHWFSGKNNISVPVRFHIPASEVKNCSVNVNVTEEGCPSVSSIKSGTIKSFWLQ